MPQGEHPACHTGPLGPGRGCQRCRRPARPPQRRRGRPQVPRLAWRPAALEHSSGRLAAAGHPFRRAAAGGQRCVCRLPLHAGRAREQELQACPHSHRAPQPQRPTLWPPQRRTWRAASCAASLWRPPIPAIWRRSRSPRRSPLAASAPCWRSPILRRRAGCCARCCRRCCAERACSLPVSGCRAGLCASEPACSWASAHSSVTRRPGAPRSLACAGCR